MDDVRCTVTVTGSVPIYHVDSKSMQGQLVLVQRGVSKRAAVSKNPANSTFVFTHDDLIAVRVQYRAPTIWHSLKANSQRRETIHFRLTADGAQPAYDAFHVDVVDADTMTSSIQDGGEDHVTGTGNRSKLIATAVTSGLAVAAAIVAVIGIIYIVFGRRRPPSKAGQQTRGTKVSPGEEKPKAEVQLPEVVLVSVSNLPPPSSDKPAVAGMVREPIGVDWSNVDPEILQHCRTTDPILSSEKVWV